MKTMQDVYIPEEIKPQYLFSQCQGPVEPILLLRARMEWRPAQQSKNCDLFSGNILIWAEDIFIYPAITYFTTYISLYTLLWI